MGYSLIFGPRFVTFESCILRDSFLDSSVGGEKMTDRCGRVAQQGRPADSLAEGPPLNPAAPSKCVEWFDLSPNNIPIDGPSRFVAPARRTVRW